MYRLAFTNFAHPAEIVEADNKHKVKLYLENNDYGLGSVLDLAIDEVVNTVCQDSTELMTNRFDEVLFTNKPSTYECKHAYQRVGMKYCAACWREDPYHRMIWNLNCVTVCLKHSELLHQQCPFCYRKIYPSKLMSGSCQCGHLYRHFSGREVNDEVLETQTVIQNALWGNSVERDWNYENQSSSFFETLFATCRLLDGLPSKLPLFNGLPVERSARFQIRNGGGSDPFTMSVATAAALRVIKNPRVYRSSVRGLLQPRARSQHSKLDLETVDRFMNHGKS